MALQGPQRPNFGARPSSSPPSGNPQVDGLGDELVKQGKVTNQQQARDWARAVVQAIKQEGLLGVNIKQSLTQLQQSMGLAPTGKLDPPTIRLIESKGWVPDAARLPDVAKDAKGPSDSRPAEAGPAEGRAPAGAGGEARTPGTQVGSKSRDPHVLSAKTATRVSALPGEGRASSTSSADRARPDVSRGIASTDRVQPEMTKNLGELLGALMSLGFLGAKRGADAIPDAVKSFQQSVALPVTGRLDPETQQALKSKVASAAPVVPEGAEGKGSAKGAGHEAKVDAKASSSTKGATEAHAAPSMAAGTSVPAGPTTDRARTLVENAQQAAVTRGLADAQATPTAVAGTGDEGQGAAVKKGRGGDGAGLETDAVGGVDDGDEDGTEHHDANAHAGDEDLTDDERGHANLAGEGDEEAGYWEVPALSAQIRAALEQIERDDDGAGPATYRWDVTFYRPGVYGAYQPGEPLWHIGIEKVGPFDPIWEEARRVLTGRLAQVEPGEPALSGEDFELALRRARARASD